MRIIPFVLLLALATCSAPRVAPAQVRTVQPIDFWLSPSGNEYFLLSDSRFVTRNNLGKTVNEFYDSSLGLPTTVDVTNPFSILLYYQDFGRVVVLDRTLSELTRIDLFATAGLQQPGAFARANDNQIWVYDSWDYKLKLLDNQGAVVRATNDLRLELQATDAPDEIFVDRGTVALLFQQKGRLAVLTNYGRFQYWVDLPPAERLSWNTPYLTGYDTKTSWRWTAGAKQTKTWALPQVPANGELQRRPRQTGYVSLSADGITTIVKTE
ncbi:hypothetical protein [Lewinella sp. 4G2]|uniref:hypothetical protein n=1 Tax=Lewinella sp. 4G2 TaxID=1803372 RepID=UPI000832FA86|nr:hypothetical protein [Lewinella sp. 4G2]